MDPIYGCVQGGHAAVQYVIEHPNGWKNQYLIYLRANVNEWISKLNFLNLDFTIFKEPDLAKITAVAIENDGKLFKKLQLIK